MIRVTLVNGNTVEVPEGKRAAYNRTIKNIAIEEVIETTLDVRNEDSSYSGAVVASFKASEVLFFEVDIDEDKDDS